MQNVRRPPLVRKRDPVEEQDRIADVNSAIAGHISIACLGRSVTSFIAGLEGRRIGAEKYEKIFGKPGRDVEELIF